MISAFFLTLTSLVVGTYGQGYDNVHQVGVVIGKVLLDFVHHEPLWHHMDYCTSAGLSLGIISDLKESELVANYTISNRIDMWLPAMDYGHEGNFTWLRNGDSATQFSEWDSDFEMVNRTANCLVMGSNGKLRSEYCGRSGTGQPYHLLCEVPTIPPRNKGIRAHDRQSIKAISSIHPKAIEIGSENSEKALKPIGVSGKFYYFEDDGPKYFWEALEACHSHGMRLATPETVADQELLIAYSMGLAQSGADPLLWTSGSDIGTPNFERPNSNYRWLSTLKNVQLQREGFIDHGNRHGCLYVTPSAIGSTSCCEGCGYANVVCEAAL